MFPLWVIAVKSRLSVSAVTEHASVLDQCTSWGTDQMLSSYTDCTFSNLNTSSASQSVFTITRCTFINCGSNSDGGLLRAKSKHNLIVDGCTFLGCWGAYGGVFRIDGDGGLQLTNTRAEYCWGSGNGGFANVNQGYITANSCEFKHIECGNGGAVVVWNGANGAVHKFENSYFENCTGTSGGALYTNSAIAGNSLEINKCRFVTCKATNGGGALYWGGAIPLSINTVIFKRCKATDGSCIYWKSDSTDYSLQSMCVVECSSPFYGLSYEDSNACSVTDIEWPPSAKFTEHDVRPRYYISGILTQLHATLWLA